MDDVVTMVLPSGLKATEGMLPGGVSSVMSFVPVVVSQTIATDPAATMSFPSGLKANERTPYSYPSRVCFTVQGARFRSSLRVSRTLSRCS